MNKSELAQHLVDAKLGSLTKTEASKLVDEVFEVIKNDVASGNEFNIPGFGKFTPSKRAERKGRNPQTGAEIKIAASTAAKFSPAKAFKDALKPEAADATKASSKKK